MSLKLVDISLTGFRNYGEFRLGNVGNLTIFVGNNAVGKTNLLEALQLCTGLSSFRHPSTDQLIREGSDFARIEASISDKSRSLIVSAVVEPGRRRYKLNGKFKQIVDLKGLLPAVVFTPDDLALAKGSSALKRNAIDDLGAQLTKNYYLVSRDYEKVVQYKNRLLKDEADNGLIESINETLVTCATQLAFYRIELYKRLISSLKSNYLSISSGETLTSSYIPSWMDFDEFVLTEGWPTRDKIKESLQETLAVKLVEERARKRCLVGPHADHIELFIDGRNVADFASQGQKRSVVLAWKLAEVEVIEDSLHQNPVLLLDDVMSELDAMRRKKLVEFVEGDIQTFITTTTLEYFDDDLLSQANVVALPPENNSIVLPDKR